MKAGLRPRAGAGSIRRTSLRRTREMPGAIESPTLRFCVEATDAQAVPLRHGRVLLGRQMQIGIVEARK